MFSYLIMLEHGSEFHSFLLEFKKAFEPDMVVKSCDLSTVEAKGMIVEFELA